MVGRNMVGTYRRQSRGGGGETREETEEDRKITDLPCGERESEWPKDSASSREIPMILKVLVSTA